MAVSPHQMKAMHHIYKWARKMETQRKRPSGAPEDKGGLSEEHQDPGAEEADLLDAPEEGGHAENQETEVPAKMTVLERFTVPSTHDGKPASHVNEEPDEDTKREIDSVVERLKKRKGR